MRVVADENLAAAKTALGSFGEVVLRPGREIGPADVADADALLVRSVTRVNERLLRDSPVRFVGSATIGIDHVDTAWLSERGIAFAHAPGCNAVAVADWVVAVLAALRAQGRHAFGSGTVGLIGAGNVGGRVRARLEALGYRVQVCDPPRAAHEGPAGFVDLDTALANDVVTLHVPLTADGEHPTAGLVDAAALARIPAGGILLNAARGGVVDEDALASRLDDGPDLQAVLDTWAGEPEIDADLLARVALGTPHIAGYSLEGRLRGTAMVVAAAAEFFGIEAGWDWRGELPERAGGSRWRRRCRGGPGRIRPATRRRGLSPTAPAAAQRARRRLRPPAQAIPGAPRVRFSRRHRRAAGGPARGRVRAAVRGLIAAFALSAACRFAPKPPYTRSNA
ncbi:MAG: 4-phosphoerythronate dehydrogenase [Halofilum sp. (in: g-proteobacteria)]|nr:4-phosphoerythronate dehydrogenase [Halofilum sp. (in: g-proteobacteria)]